MTTDTTDASFQTDVIDRSSQVPVVVDLWAPWCGPCLSLGPVIEQVVDDTAGQVELVKVNVDDNPQISSAFRVQSIPAVYALKDGAVVDGFIGAQGESEVRAFVDRLLPTAADLELTALVEAGDEASLRQALELDPAHEPAILALGHLLVDSDRAPEALALLERIPESADTRQLAARARSGEAADDLDDVTSRLDALLDQVKDDVDARQQYVDLLELLGSEDPRTGEYRRRLTARLY